MSVISVRWVSVGLACTPLLYLLLGSFNLMNDWATFYDTWRILQCFLIFISIVIYIILFNKSHESFSFDIKSIAGLLIAFIICSISILNAEVPKLAILDAMSMIALVSYGYILYRIYIELPSEALENIIAVTVLWPVYFILSLFIGWYLYFTQGLPPIAWYSWFENIRYFDDTLLPLIFLLWLKPGFLKQYRMIVIMLASFYLLMLLLHGARANWLGILAGLFMVGIIYRKNYKKIVLPILSILISYILYKGLSHIESQSVDVDIVRTTSSGRWSLWQETIRIWLENPILGIGGGNFVHLDRQVNHILGHPHNIILQLLVEWGLVGLLIIILGIYVFFKLYRQLYKLHPILVAGSIALIIDVLLSGAHVYASSQMMLILFFSYFFYSLYGKRNENDSSTNLQCLLLQTKPDKQTRSIKTFKFYPAHLGMIAIIVIFIIIGPSILKHGIGGANEYGLFGPRFWFNGYTPNLTKLYPS